MQHLKKCCHIFYEWPLNAVLHKKLSLLSFCRKYCTTKDGAQTYDFIADKRCLLFSIILKVLSGWEVVRTREKCTKLCIRIFEKILWLSKTSLVRRVTFGVFLIVNMRLESSGTTGSMDPWSPLLLYLTVPGGRGLGLGRESNLKLQIAYFKNG